MGKFTRGNYIFVTWIGDHAPRHVHVYKDGKMIVKWNLEDMVPISGKANRKIIQHIEELIKEGKL